MLQLEAKLIRDAVAKIRLIAVRANILERQYGNRPVTARPGQVEHDGQNDEQSGNHCKNGLVADNQRALNLTVFRSPYAVGRQVECPGEEQGNGKAHDQQGDDHLHHPVRRIEVVCNQVCCLGDYPRHNDVADGYPEYFTPFKFVE